MDRRIEDMVRERMMADSLKTDMVNSPPHYNTGSVETIDYIAQVTRNYSGEEGYLVGNVLKYVSRAPVKGEKHKDLQKAQWYLNRLVEVVGKKYTDTNSPLV